MVKKPRNLWRFAVFWFILRIMSALSDSIAGVWRFYRNGFRAMTWGRTLWIIILVKLFVMFVVLRAFFFRPALAGLDEEERSEAVGAALTDRR